MFQTSIHNNLFTTAFPDQKLSHAAPVLRLLLCCPDMRPDGVAVQSRGQSFIQGNVLGYGSVWEDAGESKGEPQEWQQKQEEEEG